MTVCAPWALIHGPLASHVIPIGDLRAHDPSARCWCRPSFDDDVLVHNALDRRELYQSGAVRLA